MSSLVVKVEDWMARLESAHAIIQQVHTEELLSGKPPNGGRMPSILQDLRAEIDNTRSAYDLTMTLIGRR